MDFSSSNLALVAFAHIKASDGSAYVSNGFKLTQGSAGNYQLFLSDDLIQEPSDGVYPYVVMASLASGASGSSSDGMIQTGFSGNQTITVRTVSPTNVGTAIDFTIMIWRPVVAPTLP